MPIEKSNPKLQLLHSNYLKDKGFEDWLTIRKETAVVNFQAKQSGDVIRNLMITVDSPLEMLLIDVSGRYTPTDIASIINYIEKGNVNKLVKKEI